MAVLQVLIVVDVEGPSIEGEVTALLPDQRHDRVVLRLTEHGAPRIERHGPSAQPIDWMRIGLAIETVSQKMKEAVDASGGDALHVYVAGTGPLSIFVHLGYAISKFTGTQWVIGRRPGAAWEVLPLAAHVPASNVLTAVPFPARPSPATGEVAVYLDVAARPLDADVVRAAVELGGERLADVAELRPSESITVTPDNMPALAFEVANRLAELLALYPHRSGLGVFVAGPTVFAFAVGRALNPNIVGSASLYQHAPGRYDFVYDLPFVDPVRPSLSMDDASAQGRVQVREIVVRALDALKKEIVDTDLDELIPPEERSNFLVRLAGLSFRDEGTNEFSLSIAGGTFSVDDGLLEALRNGEASMQERFAKLLLVHELFHEYQSIRSTNYFEVGRAGVVLEAVDFAADVFALRVLLAGEFRRAGDVGSEEVRRIAREWFDAVLFGVQSFDRLEHGARIIRLADRRLRRYLTWHLQAVRAEYVDLPSHVVTMLASVVTAELAPVTARVDHRYDREVLAATPATEFFAAIGGRLVRHGKRPGFDPGGLIEAVRGFNTEEIRRAMRFVVGESRPLLLPWRP